MTGADSGSFAATSGCAAPVAAGGSCTINVVFTPASLGAKTATVSIPSDDTVSGTKTVSVTGTGVNPALTLAPATLTFAAQNLGSAQSAIQTVALSNTGAAAVTTSSVTVGGPNANQFVVTFNAAACVRTRPAGAAFCNISVRFRPTAASGAGIKTATITVASNAGSVVSTVTGTGVAVPTIATAGTLGFGRRPLGSTTTTTFTVTNTGTAPLTIGAPSTTGAAYSVASGTCISAVAPGGTCQLNVTFKPTIAGNPITGTLVIPSDASNGTRTVNLTGRAP